MPEHVDIADPDIHEPKGFAAASNDTVYVKTSGAGAWQKVGPDQINLADLWLEVETAIDGGDIVFDRDLFVSGVIPDVSTSSSIYIAIPANCTVVGASSVLGGTIATANASITFFAGASSLGSAMTVAYSGSAAGDVDTFTATSNQNIAGPSFIRVTTDGASDNAVPLYVTVQLRVT